MAYECFHTIKNKREGREGLCAIKLDMHKAYDRVEWPFLKEIMLKLGFRQEWVNLIMQCVSTVEYRVRINAEESESFKPTRGLRQGDPLSPYLFLLCTEGLTSLLSHAVWSDELKGVQVCRDAPTISNLLFADDSLILMRVDTLNATSLKNALDLYCASSGQLVSDAKSSVFFSPNTLVEVRAEVCTQLNIVSEAISDKYLGLPSKVGIDRSDSFQYLVDRVCALIDSWMSKILSISGKETLLKAVAQTIPVYAMSVFNIPKNICKAICDAIARYWWGDTPNKKKIHWKA